MSRPLSFYLLRPLQQWKAGLLDCLPASVRNRVAPVVAPYVLELGDTQARLYRLQQGEEKRLGGLDLHESHVDAGLASILQSRKAPLLLLAPEAWVLHKQVSLPAAARENLRQVIQFEMDRLTPFSADQVYYDFQVDRTAVEELIPVSIALLPRKRIDSWLALLNNAHIRPDRISSPGLPADANFLPEESRPGTNVKQAVLKTLPGVLALILLLASMALPLWQKRNVAIAMKDKEIPLKKQANAVVSIRNQLQAEQQRIEAMHAAWTRFPPAVDVLKVLTGLLPDDTSLQQMDIKEAQLILRGTSGQASSLIKLLEESSGFSDVKFISSVVQQRGKEQFHLSANIVMPFMQKGKPDAEPPAVAKPSKPEDAPVATTAEPAAIPASGSAVVTSPEPATSPPVPKTEITASEVPAVKAPPAPAAEIGAAGGKHRPARLISGAGG